MILIPALLNAQECREIIRDYFQNLDTTERKVYRIVDEAPSIVENNQPILSTWANIDFSKLTCCPNYVWYAFVIEKDGTTTNIHVCPTFFNCENDTNLIYNTINIIEQYTKIITEIKATPGKMDQQPVAVAYISRVHYECWSYDLRLENGQ